MKTKLLSLSGKSSDLQLSFYHKNKSEDVIRGLLKPLKNRKVLWATVVLLALLSVWYYFN